MRIFNHEYGKLTNIKKYIYSNKLDDKKRLDKDQINKINLANYINNKMSLKKNNSSLKGQFSSPSIFYSNDFSIKRKKFEQLTQRVDIKQQKNSKNIFGKLSNYKKCYNLKKFSFANNFINDKVNQYEEIFKNDNNVNKGQILNNKSDIFWNEKMSDIGIFKKIMKIKNNANKKNIHKSNEILSNRTISNIKGILMDNKDAEIKINNKKYKGYNQMFNKYISFNIMNSLNSFNKIKNLIASNGFSINENEMKKIYKENIRKGENFNKSYNMNTQNIITIKKLENLEKYKKEKVDSFQSMKDKEYSENSEKREAISRNKNLPLIKSEIKEKPYKYNILNSSNNKNEIKNFKIFKKEFTIRKEVNKYYQENNYKSYREFFKDWITENKTYLSINDIEFFLNKIIKISIPITREDIIHIFFKKNELTNFNYNRFKNFFWPYEAYSTSEENNFHDRLSNKILVNYENKIISEIINSKMEILEKLGNKSGCKALRSDFILNYEQFYNLMKNILIIYNENFFEIAIRNIFYENYISKSNKINILDFLLKICEPKSYNQKESEERINNSEIKSDKNKIRKKFLNRINSLKDKLKINLEKKMFGKEEISQNFNNLDKNTNTNINNKLEKFEIDKFNYITSFRADFNKTKKKNFDIINLI